MATILIVDDRAICREFLVTLLGYGNHRLMEAADGEKAYAILMRERPHLIITDLLMPNMNGYELVQKIKTDPQLSTIPIIFYTASFLLEEAKLLAETCDVKYVLYKPSDPQLILETVNMALCESGDASSQTIQKVPLYETNNLLKQNNVTSIEDKLMNCLAELESLQDENNKSAKQITSILHQAKLINHRLATMLALNLTVLTQRELKSILMSCCHGAREILDCQYCAIAILNPETGQLKQFVLSGGDEAKNKAIGIPHRDCELFNLILEAEHIFQDNQANHVQLPSQHPQVHSLLGAKMMTSTHLYGLIYWANKTNSSVFNDEDAHIASALASQIAILYENADRYDAIQRHAANLQIKLNQYTSAG